LASGEEATDVLCGTDGVVGSSSAEKSSSILPEVEQANPAEVKIGDGGAREDKATRTEKEGGNEWMSLTLGCIELDIKVRVQIG
jgi:hypothetical protein